MIKLSHTSLAVEGNLNKGGKLLLSKLDDLRQQIDNIDDQLLKLINRRGLLAQKIGEEKARQGKKSHFHVPQRERAILERLQDQSKGPFPSSSIKSIFREIFSATLALEKPFDLEQFRAEPWRQRPQGRGVGGRGPEPEGGRQRRSVCQPVGLSWSGLLLEDCRVATPQIV